MTNDKIRERQIYWRKILSEINLNQTASLRNLIPSHLL